MTKQDQITELSSVWENTTKSRGLVPFDKIRLNRKTWSLGQFDKMLLNHWAWISLRKYDYNTLEHCDDKAWSPITRNKPQQQKTNSVMDSKVTTWKHDSVGNHNQVELNVFNLHARTINPEMEKGWGWVYRLLNTLMKVGVGRLELVGWGRCRGGEH